MRTYRDAKLMAKSLRQSLAQKDIELGHGECLDVIARLFECDNWNVLAARIEVDAPTAAPQDLPMPEGWTKAGSRPDIYLMGVDTSRMHHGQHPAVIRCSLNEEASRIYNQDPGFGTLMQAVKAGSYRGKRLRLTANLCCAHALKVQMWMRVDSRHTRGIRFDNMDNRPLHGTQDWTLAEVVLQVPDEADTVNFGFFVVGTGTAGAAGFKLEIVDTDTEETGALAQQVLDAPSNLDFGALTEPTAAT
ncbi:glyoxalase superfamily protein [Andreprevotia chitinilytica]|uniref:glyoxalase superfamily protein n=1 Tax=Andreprevotia chitinilytica TaxID=396808 RepID=UPI000690EB35|nr:glyoxalase superfamily protein [Andreprevotia chitinilytica]